MLLTLTSTLYDALLGHLIRKDSRLEQAAFLFASASPVDTGRFEVVESAFMGADNFETQGAEYLELTDDTKASVIKRAHDLNASLIEVHSHPGPWPAQFSAFDLTGLRETVPHMQWRLPKRPYIAIVVAKSGFDALVWSDDSKRPGPLEGLVVDGKLIRPTNRTLGR